jgi:CubicO group peptidase (beta-lactamase class C family)
MAFRNRVGLPTTIAVSLGLFAATGAAQLEQIGTARQIYDGTLYPDIQVQTFRNIDRLFPTRTVKRGPNTYPLPPADKPLQALNFVSSGQQYDLYDYLSLNRVSGLLVLKDGKIAFERYELGNNPTTRWMSMSMVKSISSTLVGIAIQDGYIQSLNDPITKYLPTLAASAYEGVTVRNLLQMSSGVRWDETYTNPASDRRRMLGSGSGGAARGALSGAAGAHEGYEGRGDRRRRSPRMQVWAGQSAAMARPVPAGELVARIWSEATALLS